MIALTKRNLLLYFRNRSGVFFSLLAAMISFVLYIIFLKNSMINSWQEVPNSHQLLDLWLIGGTLSVTAITTTFTSLGQLVKDKEREVIKDFYLTDLSHFEIKISYMLSASLIGFLMQLMMLFLMMGYFSITDSLTIPWASMPAVICVALFSSLLAVVINMLFIQLINRFDSLGALETIVGTASGFLVGTYIPFGILPNFAQFLIKLTPGAYVAAIYRQIFMSDKLRRAFHGQQNHFEKMMGIKLEWHHLLTGMQTAVFLIVIFLLGIVALLTVDLIRSKKNVRTVD
ncbi:ABC transporter permease [Enterococcus italicus]|uniref:ABC-2 type transporter n=1 Tax=Enterococcus italicus (strain DSM 15952 / CCUG 50447 / LMG 22039 / TP 1.5) TaxID=888064 RepID=E6LIS8_ENTI1|nr:ABC transporter permease [Enterococcus italicus]EFU72899.1 ABC-2 type transporter [Enterococcus italicus DSM 15952]OJG56748.1 multidrug ABC transporter permease [Enterococcus italicus DSM 15952]